MVYKGFKEDRMFWASITCFVAMAPIIIWLPSWLPFNFMMGIFLADFLVAVSFLCIWIERQERKAREPLKVRLLKGEDLEKYKDHLRYVPGLGLAVVMTEEEQKGLREARGETD